MSSSKVKWYDPESLTVSTEVWNANGSKKVKPTLTHARKLGLLPSVTSVLAMLDSYALNEWGKDQCIAMCQEFPFTGDTDNPEKREEHRVMIRAKQSEGVGVLADRGSLMHGQIEQALAQGIEPSDPACVVAVDSIRRFLAEHGAAGISCEAALGSRALGYAGTPDLSASAAEGAIVLDFKTCDDVEKRKPYDKEKIQLGAYRNGLGADARLFLVPIGREDGAVKFTELDEPDRWEQAWCQLLEAWFTIKGFDPRKV